MLITLRRAAAASLALSAPLFAQGTSMIRLRVIDAFGAPMAGVDVAVLRGFKDILAHGVTDDSGSRVLAFPTSPSELEVTARRIGFVKANRMFQISHADTLAFTLALRAVPRELDTVKVAARATHDYYHIDADAIAESTKPLRTAWDIVSRLRPEMLKGHATASCGGIRSVFVNGKRIVLPPRPQAVDAQRARATAPSGALYSADAVTVLSDIRPEHVESIDYHDCFDSSVMAVGNQNGVFITLKPGVMYEPGTESFVLPPLQSREGKP